MQAKPWKHITKMHESVYYPVRVQATVALALAGALFVSQILQEQGAFSVPRPADRQGALKAPNRESGTELWSQLKTPNASKQEGKVGGEKEDVAALSLPILFFLVGFFPPSLVWRTFGSSLSVTLNICIWISENREQNHFVFFWWRSRKTIRKLPPRTIIRTADIIKRSRLFGGWKDRIQDTGRNVMQFTWVYFHGNNIFPL